MTQEAHPRLASAAWLTEGPLAKLLSTLNRDGETARVVGGALRDALLGEPLGDIDVATTAVPPEVVLRARAAGFKTAPTGIEHGTVTVIVDGAPFEVTTLREDVETFGRKAKVLFGRDWRRDAERRDFTMNALSASPDGVVHDYVGGLADLDRRRVVFIGDPRRRIAEDYLRVLRFFRFHAAYGRGAPDSAGLAASIAARDHLAQLSRERIRMEMLKLLLGRRAAPTVEVMADCGILGRVIGGVPLLRSLSDMIAIEAALGVAPDPIRRLGALALFVTEDAERLWQRLRLSNAEHDRLSAMADAWWRVAPARGERASRALLYRLGPERYTDRVLLAWARSRAEASDATWSRMASLPERWTAPAAPVKAADLMAQGVEKGPALGKALQRAEAFWIDADFPDDAESIGAILRRAIRSPD